ncbi:hypothetical protein EJB05_03005, partial [Eragrostis curvula]
MSGGAATVRGLLLGGAPLSPLTVKLLHGRLLRLDLHHTDLPQLLVRALSSSGLHLHALRLHSLLPNPSHLTFPFALRSASHLPHHHHPLSAGVQLHAHSLKLPSHSNPHVLTSLLNFYAKCGHLHQAQRVFDEMPHPSTVSWTALITAYMDAGRVQEAVGVARNAFAHGMRPDSFTAVRVLTACARVADLVTGEAVWNAAQQEGLSRSVFVATAAMDLYIKCGEMEKAREVFDNKMPNKDAVAWGTMVTGYASNSLPQEALDLFFAMQAKRMKPDCYTVAGVLSACTRLGALELGRRAVGMLQWDEFLDNPVLGTALIDMYAKCGCTGEAWELFQQMRKRDIVVWNAMILGLGLTGHEKIAFALVGQMNKLGITLNDNTFIGLLCSCTHTGLVQDGRRYFHNMTHVYRLSPRIEHYGCMVDLLSRAGQLDEAHQLIQDMPMQANAVVWGALLGGCKIHRNAELAEHVLKQLIRLEPWNSGNYVMLSNIYSNSGRWEDAATLRLDMKKKGVEKVLACSWVEFKGKVHEFRVGDKSHPLSDQIYAKLDELGMEMKAMGYKPTTEVVMFDIEDKEKESTLVHHSEKIAIAFSLLTAGPGETIRVTKNLRVCSDCHTAIKLISRITHHYPETDAITMMSNFLQWHSGRLPWVCCVNIGCEAVTISNAPVANLKTVVIGNIIRNVNLTRRSSKCDIGGQSVLGNGVYLTGKVFSTNCMPSGSEDGKWSEDADAAGSGGIGSGTTNSGKQAQRRREGRTLLFCYHGCGFEVEEVQSQGGDAMATWDLLMSRRRSGCRLITTARLPGGWAVFTLWLLPPPLLLAASLLWLWRIYYYLPEGKEEGREWPGVDPDLLQKVAWGRDRKETRPETMQEQSSIDLRWPFGIGELREYPLLLCFAGLGTTEGVALQEGEEFLIVRRQFGDISTRDTKQRLQNPGEVPVVISHTLNAEAFTSETDSP